MTPLQSLYFFAPVCGALNLMLLPFFEGSAPFKEIELVGLPILVG